MRRVAAAVAMLGGLSACSLLVSTSGLSGGDATSTPSNPDGGPGSGGDGSTSDAPSSDGPKPDAPTFAGDAAASPCTSPHLFCDDFDTGGSSLAGRWDMLRENAGPLSLDTAVFLSAPRALRATLTRGSGVRISALDKTVTPKSPKLSLDFDAFTDGTSAATFTEIDPVDIGLTPPPAGFKNHGFVIAIYPTKTVLQYYKSPSGGGMSTAVESEFSFPLSRWVHVTLTIDYTSSPAIGSVALDGARVTQVTLDGTAPTSVDFGFGGVYTADVNVDFNVVFDNVVVD